MPFRYLKDPLFLVCFAAYFINRLILKPLVVGGFLHDHFNDLICIPFWLPMMLALMRLLRLRKHDGPPSVLEIAVPVVLWSVWFEGILPRYTTRFVADIWDVFWYALGGVGAFFVWRKLGSTAPISQKS
jgi:hypothetical protein